MKSTHTVEVIGFESYGAPPFLNGCTSTMVIAPRSRVRERFPWWMFLQMLDSAPKVFNEQPSQITADPESGHDSLHHEIFSVGRHGIGRNLPTSDSQPVS